MKHVKHENISLVFEYRALGHVSASACS